MTEPNYQKPPLREEIEAFFKQLKGVIFTIIGFSTLIAIVFGLHMFSKTDMAHQIGAYINKHFPAFTFTIMIDILSYAILYEALYRKHLIYKRYRLGYFSQMMWYFIGFVTIQLLNIPIALYLDGLIPIIIVEIVALGFTALALSDYKKEHPPLVRPLTEEENKLRKHIIDALLNSYRMNSYQIGTGVIETDAKAFARACYLMDFYPEFFNTLTATNIQQSTPLMFYSDTLENSQNTPFIDIEDPRYKTYRERARHQMTRDLNPESPFKLNKESFFE